jgi:hypothetical protein
MVAVVTLLALIPAWPGAAQTRLEELPGLVRAVSRYYLGPLSVETTYISTTPNEQGTPVCVTTLLERPVREATPDPATATGVEMFTITVRDFDEPTATGAAYAVLVEERDTVVASDPSAHPLVLEGIVDQATGIVVDAPGDAGDVPIQIALAVAQDGPYLYFIQGFMAGLDPVTVIRDILAVLAANAASSGEGTYDPAGGSTGGLWDKLEGVERVLGPGVVPTTDFVLVPAPEATPPGGCGYSD